MLWTLYCFSYPPFLVWYYLKAIKKIWKHNFINCCYIRLALQRGLAFFCPDELTYRRCRSYKGCPGGGLGRQFLPFILFGEPLVPLARTHAEKQLDLLKQVTYSSQYSKIPAGERCCSLIICNKMKNIHLNKKGGTETTQERFLKR